MSGTGPRQDSGSMWCDDFDADLLKVVPGAAEALGPAAHIGLWTYSHLTGGVINCPSAWNTYDGLTAFFWTAPEHRPDSSWWTDAPVVTCTFLEAVRDEWVHGSVVNVDGTVVWRPPVRLMDQLMYDLRGWTPLSDSEREEIRGHVLVSLRRAAERMTELAAPPATTQALPLPLEGSKS